MNKKELIIGFFEKGYCCDLDEVKDTCLGLLKENQELKLELSGYRHAILNNKEMLGLKEQNDKLKKQVEDANEKIILLQASEPMLNYKKALEETQQKEFINYLEDEKNRLAREISNLYEDSLGHTRLVNEDIFDEVNDILQKYKEITGVKDENNIK